MCSCAKQGNNSIWFLIDMHLIIAFVDIILFESWPKIFRNLDFVTINCHGIWETMHVECDETIILIEFILLIYEESGAYN